MQQPKLTIRNVNYQRMRCPEESAKENTVEPFKNYQRMRCLEESTKKILKNYLRFIGITKHVRHQQPQNNVSYRGNNKLEVSLIHLASEHGFTFHSSQLPTPHRLIFSKNHA
jgi:hypothetical protein